MVEPRSISLWCHLSLALIALATTTGCVSHGDSPRKTGSSAQQQEAVRSALVRALRFGMRSTQVVGWIGEPQSIKPSPTDPVVEHWVYLTPLPTTYKNVAIEIQEVPWVDPITGEVKIIREPLPGQQRIDGTEILTLTFRDGILHQIDRSLDERKTYSR